MRIASMAVCLCSLVLLGGCSASPAAQPSGPLYPSSFSESATPPAGQGSSEADVAYRLVRPVPGETVVVGSGRDSLEQRITRAANSNPSLAPHGGTNEQTEDGGRERVLYGDGSALEFRYVSNRLTGVAIGRK
jgi:hypothetical protein